MSFASLEIARQLLQLILIRCLAYVMHFAWLEIARQLLQFHRIKCLAHVMSVESLKRLKLGFQSNQDMSGVEVT